MSIVVLLQEEYGYREWVWMPNMSADELKAWWKAMPTVAPFFFNGPVEFPGETHQIYFEEDGFYLVTEGDMRVVTPVSGKFDLDEDKHWHAHLHQDNDSFLKSPDGEYIHHAGWVSDEEYYSDDYQSPTEVESAWDASMHEQFKKIIEESPVYRREPGGDSSNN